jgi:hypothetical protein
MSKHTPGPWAAHFEEAYYVTGPDLGRVAMMMNLKGAHGMGGRRSGDESAANCRLIAAAPDLLQALLNLVGTMCAADGSDIEADLDAIDAKVAAAREAIAKATGEQA